MFEIKTAWAIPLLKAAQNQDYQFQQESGKGEAHGHHHLATKSSNFLNIEPPSWRQQTLGTFMKSDFNHIH